MTARSVCRIKDRTESSWLPEERPKQLKDRRKFYRIAFASHREVQAVLDLADSIPATMKSDADFLAANLYKQVKALE